MSGWQLIETAPKDGTDVLLWTPVGVQIASWSDRYSFWDTGFASEVDGDPIEAPYPSHWMTLPGPPV
jgi:hypothetical protein